MGFEALNRLSLGDATVLLASIQAWVGSLTD